VSNTSTKHKKRVELQHKEWQKMRETPASKIGYSHNRPLPQFQTKHFNKYLTSCIKNEYTENNNAVLAKKGQNYVTTPVLKSCPHSSILFIFTYRVNP
jgi:hypothetical protein